MNVNTNTGSINGNGRTIVITSLIMMAVFIVVSTLVFFISLKSEEQVMVPNVTGKDLPEALLELQAKELYPKIQLRYSEKEKGIIIEQDPAAGSIVKGGKRIELVISQGTVASTIQNYIGENIEEVQRQLKELFTSDNRHYIRVKQPPLIKPSNEPAGTILEQEPPAGSPVFNNMELTFVVSQGSEEKTTAVPNLVNADLDTVYRTMQKAQLVFAFSASDSASSKNVISISKQNSTPQSSVPLFSRVELSVALPEPPPEGMVCGILQTTLMDFPYPFTVSLHAAYQNGGKKQLVSFRHPGGDCSIPYMVPKGTTLSIEVLNKEVYAITAGTQAQ